MTDAVAQTPFYLILCGVIWAIALGFAVGNYACSLVHRLPRGRLILDKKPYCGHCGALLQVKDLFPVFSALLLKHRCRYCGTPFPVSHTWTELLVGLLFVLGYLQLGFSDHYILVITIGVFLITLAAIHANEGMVMGRVLLCVMVSGAMLRILNDHTIYNFFQGGFLALIAGVVVWHNQIEPKGHIYKLPKHLELLVVGGICVGALQLPVFFALYLLLFALSVLLGKLRGKPIPYTVPFGLAVTLILLYPNMMHL